MTDFEKKQRVEMIRSMEFIARALNDEELLVGVWFMNGVDDGGINENTTDEEIFINYCESEEQFQDLMACFARLMRYATNSEDKEEDEDLKKGNGVFYTGGLVSKRDERYYS